MCPRPPVYCSTHALHNFLPHCLLGPLPHSSTVSARSSPAGLFTCLSGRHTLGAQLACLPCTPDHTSAHLLIHFIILDLASSALCPPTPSPSLINFLCSSKLPLIMLELAWSALIVFAMSSTSTYTCRPSVEWVGLIPGQPLVPPKSSINTSTQPGLGPTARRLTHAFTPHDAQPLVASSYELAMVPPHLFELLFGFLTLMQLVCGHSPGCPTRVTSAHSSN